MANVPKKGIHTSPEKAGAKNLDAKRIAKSKASDPTLMSKLIPIHKIAMQNYHDYKGQWTDEQLASEIGKMFDHCNENELQVNQPLLRLWLGVSRQTVWEWKNNPNKYPGKSYLINHALELMEYSLQNSIFKYPTGSIFLLKTSHGHVESSKLDITTNGNDVTNADEVKDLIVKLGLDK